MAQYAIPAILASPVGVVIAGATGIFGWGYYRDQQNQRRHLEKMMEVQRRFEATVIIGCTFIVACMVCYLSYRHPGNSTVS